MNRCIIHIGMHKTGSTSIQGSLHGFADDRFFYANLGGVPNHSLAMYSMFVAQPEKHHIHKALGRDLAAVRVYVSRMRSDLERSIADAGNRTLIISGEDISVLPLPALTKLRDYFRERCVETVIMGYIRSPLQFITSGFQQRVQGGSATRLDPEREYRNYEKTFSCFDDVFGRANVHLWKFDPAAFAGGCAVRDFCSKAGIEIPQARIIRLNESLSRQVLALLYTYRKFGQIYGARTMTGAESNRLGRILAGVGKDRFRLSPDIVRPVLERHRADIAWMEARLGQSLAEDLGPALPGDVGDEADLLTPDAAVSGKLVELLGEHAPAGVKGETAEQVALLMHCLRRLHGEIQVHVPELIAELRQSNPGLMVDVPDGRAAALVRQAYRQIHDALAHLEEGVIGIQGLGQFRVKAIGREIGGREVRRTQISFRRSGSDDESSSNPARTEAA